MPTLLVEGNIVTMYEVWGAGLNSLYNETPNQPVLLYVVKGLQGACDAVEREMTHSSAAWYAVARCATCSLYVGDGLSGSCPKRVGFDPKDWACDEYSNPLVR